MAGKVLILAGLDGSREATIMPDRMPERLALTTAALLGKTGYIIRLTDWDDITARLRAAAGCPAGEGEPVA